jgi:hypothetical protein
VSNEFGPSVARGTPLASGSRFRRLAKQPKLLRMFTERCFVLSQAHYEDFMRSLLATAPRYRRRQLRKHLAKGMTPDDQAHIRTCDLPSLIRVVQRKVLV